MTWKFQKKPTGYWDNTHNLMAYLDWLGKQLGHRTMEDWYNITVEDILQNGGGGLARSPSKLLMRAYPQHDWVQWKFLLSADFWKDQKNQLDFLDWMGIQRDHTTLEGWYNVTVEDIRKNGAIKLLSNYNGSPSKALEALYPQHKWMSWRFKQFVGNEKKQSRKDFFAWLGQQLGLNNLEDWYNITVNDILLQHGGSTILGWFGWSPSTALSTVFPDHNWQIWRFRVCPKGYYDSLLKNQKEQRRIIDWLGDQLSIKQLEDWNRVAITQVQQYANIKSRQDLGTILQNVYPDHQWNLFNKAKIGPIKASQRMLATALQKIFPNHSN